MQANKIKEFSLKLSEEMEDIGVTDELIAYRRYVCKLLKKIYSLTDKQRDHHQIFVGSHMEGSTTFGMNSDLDSVYYLKYMRAILHSSDRRSSDDMYLVIRNKQSFPGCCNLTNTDKVIKPVVLSNNLEFVADQQGGILLLNKVIEQTLDMDRKLAPNHRYEQNGPAITTENVVDSVLAVFCSSLHDDCLTWMIRPRPGHWPKQETLTKAKQCGMFLVHPGRIGHVFTFDSTHRMGYMDKNFEDDYASTQWRMSTNKIEKLLIFDLNLSQMKTFIILKMIRKEFLKPLVGDRLSTFHVKTAFLFTVEQYAEHIWRTDNLVQCILLCLNTLMRFLKRRVCPHYTVAAVNLFSRKLKVCEFIPLLNKVTAISNTNLKCVTDMKMDNIGNRLYVSPDDILMSREGIRLKTILNLLMETRYGFMSVIYKESVSCQAENFESYIEMLMRNFRSARLIGNKYKNELHFFFEIICSILASVKASECISNGRTLTDDFEMLYGMGLWSKQIELYLKLASTLMRQYGQAEELLEKIEKMIGPDMFQFPVTVHDSVPILELVSSTTTSASAPRENYLTYFSKAMFPVVFTRHEIYCAPVHLHYEMYRTITSDDDRVHMYSMSTDQWTAWAVSDAKPFLYYLTFLSSSRKEKKVEAFNKLAEYCKNNPSVQQYELHFETALNMFGHALELLDRKSEAWNTYMRSILYLQHKMPLTGICFAYLDNIYTAEPVKNDILEIAPIHQHLAW